MALCSIIVLNYNGKHFLGPCLDSLRQQTFPHCETILVDNNSQDGSVDFVAQNYPAVHILALKTNGGFCGGNNAGIRDAIARGAQYVLVLNNDTTLAPDCVEQMFHVLQNDPNTAVVCPKIYFSARPNHFWYAGADFNLWTSRSRFYGFNDVDSGQFDTVRPITQSTGCAMLMPVRVLEKIGLLDESFWTYAEDLDWSVRFHKAGYLQLYAPDAHLWHADGGTNVAARSHARRQYLTTRNMVLLGRKHARWFQLPSYICGFLIFHVLFFSLLRLSRRDYPAFTAIFRGLRDGLKRSPDYTPSASLGAAGSQ